MLRSALSKRLTSGSTTETNAVFQVAENGLREAGIDFKFSHVLEDASKEGSQETKDDEIYALVKMFIIVIIVFEEIVSFSCQLYFLMVCRLVLWKALSRNHIFKFLSFNIP